MWVIPNIANELNLNVWSSRQKYLANLHRISVSILANKLKCIKDSMYANQRNKELIKINEVFRKKWLIEALMRAYDNWF